MRGCNNVVGCNVRREKRCNSLVNSAYGLQIPFELDFTRFLRICAPAKKQKLANGKSLNVESDLGSDVGSYCVK